MKSGIFRTQCAVSTHPSSYQVSEKDILSIQKLCHLISLLGSSTHNRGIVWLQIPAAGKSSLQGDRFRSLSLMNLQIDVARLMLTGDVKFPLHWDSGKEDLSHLIILPIL